METVVLAVVRGDVDRVSGALFGESREKIDAVTSSVRGVTDSNW